MKTTLMLMLMVLGVCLAGFAADTTITATAHATATPSAITATFPATATATAITATSHATATTVTNAAESPEAIKQRRKEAMERFKMRKGGFIVNLQKAKGAIMFVDAQTRVGGDVLKAPAEKLQNDSWVRCTTVKAEGITLANVAQRVKEAKWDVAVILVDDPALPMQLVQPEGRWALVNVAALAVDSPAVPTLVNRVQKQALRAVAFVFGCGYSLNAGGIAQPLCEVADLDKTLAIALPVDIFTTIQALAPRFGMSAGRRCFYIQALQEGWAPPPTNKYQKYAWEHYHSEKERGPANAIKIAPPKK